jgi:electron transfer flavoprotein alpha subunit
MTGEIYVLLDHSKGRVDTLSRETLALAQQLGHSHGLEVKVLLLCGPSRSAVENLAGLQVDEVLVVSHERLEQYDPDAHCQALTQVLAQDRPLAFLMGHSYQNIDLAPKLAASLKCGLVTDCIDCRIDGESMIFVRQMFRNRINADVRVRSPHPWIATFQSGAGAGNDLLEGDATVVERTVDLSGLAHRRTVVETVGAVKEKVDLTKADMIVAAGRGIKRKENLRLLEELAEVLGAELGASRAAVDSEWLERDRQIGSSGQSVAPRLYIACGISGAIQHVVGMRNSANIVAINTDPDAPIFNLANYGIVGDLVEIVPALTRKLREEKAR